GVEDGRQRREVGGDGEASRCGNFAADIDLVVGELPNDDAELNVAIELRVFLGELLTQFAARQSGRELIVDQEQGDLSVGTNLHRVLELGMIEDPHGDLIAALERVVGGRRGRLRWSGSGRWILRRSLRRKCRNDGERANQKRYYCPREPRIGRSYSRRGTRQPHGTARRAISKADFADRQQAAHRPPDRVD